MKYEIDGESKLRFKIAVGCYESFVGIGISLLWRPHLARGVRVASIYYLAGRNDDGRTKIWRESRSGLSVSADYHT